VRRVIKKLKVKGSAHSYEIWVGQDLHLSFQGLPTHGKARKMYFVADSRLKSLAQTWVQALKKQGHSVEFLTVHASEALKAFDAITPIYSWLLKKGADRSSLLWVMGGGTLGDALGFVAGTYLRGIDWVSVPTTLLAQVDSGVGGKTALNHSMGKNLIGVFHQPVAVLCDTQVLHRLPQREVYSGLGEVIKYALIFEVPKKELGSTSSSG
jgi:3-dehydroquinate synthase